MEQAKDSTPKPSFSSGLTIIEKAQELRWTLRLGVAVMFADLLLVWKTGSGITDWSASADQFLANSGSLIAGLLAFSVLTSIILPIAGEIFRRIVWELIINVPVPNWLRTERDYRRPFGCVLSRELLDHAIATEDKFPMELYSTHQQMQSLQQSEEFATGQLLFAVLTISFFNYCANWLELSETTLLQELAIILGQYNLSLLFVGLLFGLAGLTWAWFSDREMEWIYYPPLYDRIEKERRKQLGFPPS